MIGEYTPMNIKNESASDKYEGYTKEENKGRYLYGDYSPFEESKNFIHLLKDFVSTSANIIEIHRKVGTIRIVLENVDVFQDEIIRKIENLRNSIDSSVNAFHNKYHERIVDSSDIKKDAEFSFFRMRAPLMNSIRETEMQFTKYANDYREEIQSRILDSYNNAIVLLQIWLSKDQSNLPNTLLERRNKILTAKIDEDPYSYSISSANEVLVNTGTSNSSALQVDDLDSLPSPSISYHFTIDAKFSDFWRHRRKISDLGIDDLLIPIGFKKSISEKLRRSLRLGSNPEESQDSSERELEFIHAGSLYITYIRMQVDKTLAVRLSGDPSRSDEKVIELEYNLLDLIPENNIDSSTAIQHYKTLVAEGRFPRIDYIDKDEKRKIDLTQKEFQEGTDTLKLVLMGKMLADRMKDLYNTTLVSPHTILDSIRVGDKEAIMVSNDQNKSPLYYEDLVISFLQLIASGFSPLIQRILDKGPVKEELILRFETDDKERKEYVLRKEELSSQLSTDEGRRILERLNL